MRAALRPFLLAGALLLGGCGTFANLGDQPQIYGGLRYDIKDLGNTGPCSTALISCVDVPFSLVLDTVLLPVTLFSELGH
ncbi:MAG: YceK/YidQ family lipoprotein [Planctomycetes bacterium]|nr:YceK/YidQ family lipoprotein [Planctomycetota bacterium]